MVIKDYIIVGGGFSGLYLKNLMDKNSMDYLLLEGQELGGQLNLYSQKYIYDIPGVIKITAEDLKNSLMMNNHNIIDQTVVHSIDQEGDYKKITTIKNNKSIIYYGKKVILTCGKGLIQPVIFHYPGLETLIEKEKILFSLNKKPWEKIAILGGGDSALDGCWFWNSLGAQTFLFHRRQLTAMAGKIQLMENNTEFFLNSTIESLDLINDKVLIKYLWNNENYQLEVDGVVMLYGIKTDPNPLINIKDSIKLAVHRENLSVIDHGVIDFALGDIAIYDNKRFLIHNYMAECQRLINFLKNNISQ
jgi:thioredoxin reductase